MGTRTRPCRARQATPALALALTLVSSATQAATLTCQDRSVRAVAEWDGLQADSARASDYGVFDHQAVALEMDSYPYYTTSAGRARQVSQALGSTLQVLCTAEAQFVTLTGQTGAASADSHLEFCFHLDRAGAVTILAQANGESWSDAAATSRVVFAGPEGLHLELVRRCTSGVCDGDSLLAVTRPIPAGDYVLEADANAAAAWSTSGGQGNWMATTSLDVSVGLSESFVSVAGSTWSAVKRLYRDPTQ